MFKFLTTGHRNTRKITIKKCTYIIYLFVHLLFFHFFIKVVLQNNESTKSQASMQIYRAPAGRKYT